MTFNAMKQLFVKRKSVVDKYIFQKRFCSKWKDLIQVSEIVSKGIANHIPMVALESTVLTHGMPWPTNLLTAKSLEDIIIAENCIPVTIGLLHNVIKAGFNSEELEELATSEIPKKVSRRDLYNINNIKYGGTTVSATMIVAQKLGINIFATGGIGGVHQNFNNTMDVSADIKELGRTPVCVVSSGIKSFLDISKTLEYLETEGVFVATLGSNDFPGFFIRSSGFKTPYRIDTIEEASYMIDNMTKLNISSGMLLAVPIPICFKEDGILIQNAIDKAIKISEEMKIYGSEVTPFLLQKVNKLTKGKSLELNINLIKNNAKIGAKIAFYLNKIRKVRLPIPLNIEKENKSTFAVIGGSIVDNYLKLVDPNIKDFKDLIHQASYNCTSFQTSGGVARNMADVFARLNEKSYFLSAVGNDLSANFLKENADHINWQRVKQVQNVETSNCSVIILSNNNVLFHLGNFEIVEHISKNYIDEHLSSIKENLNLICLDTNLRQDVMEYVFNFAKSNNIIVFVEPTDTLLAHKSLEVLATKTLSFNPIDIISPNISEFRYMYNVLLREKEKFGLKIYSTEKVKDECSFEYVQFIMEYTNLLDLIPNWIIKLGHTGVIFASKKESFFIQQSKYFINNEEIVNVSGAGDCLAACALFLHYKGGLSWKYSIAGGIRMAKESLYSQRTVPVTIDPRNYTKNEIERWMKEMLQNKLLIFIK